MGSGTGRYDLEERLLEFSGEIIKLVESMSNTRAAGHVGGQLLRSGTSPYFNHGEAEAAESPKDFVHKMGICLKELRETKRALRLIVKARLATSVEKVDPLLTETEELIRIFYASIRTARSNAVKEEPVQEYASDV